MLKKKKRKFKKSFKILVFVFSVFIIFLIYFFLNLNSKKSNQIIEIDTQNNLKEEKKTDTKKNILSSQEKINLFLINLKSLSKEINFQVSSTSLKDSDGLVKIFLKNTFNDSGYIYIDTMNDIENVWINFISAVLNNPLKENLINNFSNLEYIDLRFGSKIYYKFYKS